MTKLYAKLHELDKAGVSHMCYCTYICQAHMMLSIGEMCRNGIQHHAPPDDPYALISLQLILSGLILCL